jgi:hypothetical protein
VIEEFQVIGTNAFRLAVKYATSLFLAWFQVFSR